jgi:Ca2+:H+ antiporter
MPTSPAPGPSARGLAATLGRTATVLAVAAVAGTVATLGLRLAGASEVAIFLVAALTLAGLAALVGEATDQLGSRLGPGTTGVLQSALGNLPELFISLFALRKGLVVLVQTALVGSILANSLLVLGLAFLAGGLRNGRQVFHAAPVRNIAVVLVLAVASLAIPTIATAPGAPDAGHAVEISVFVSIVLLVVFAASIPYSLGGGQGASQSVAAVEAADRWPFWLAIAVLSGAGVGAAVVSDWFVEALRPAMATLGLSEAFVGLVVVAIAGNAVENVVGIKAAVRNRTDLSISLIQNSSLQVAIALTPALVLASLFVSPVPLTLVLAPTLLASLALAAILGALVVFDGESTWLEGLLLLGLYLVIAASVWYGAPIAR